MKLWNIQDLEKLKEDLSKFSYSIDFIKSNFPYTKVVKYFYESNKTTKISDRLIAGIDNVIKLEQLNEGINKNKLCECMNEGWSKVDTCNFKHIIIDEIFYERDIKNYDYNERCHDCGIINGNDNIHHFGCGIERCPKCGNQLISCDCHKTVLRLLRLGSEIIDIYDYDNLINRLID